MSLPDPSVTVPTLSDYQFSINGLTLGSDTPFGIKPKIEGLGTDKLRTGDAGRPRDHGEFIGLDLLPGRDIILTIDVGQMSGGTFGSYGTLQGAMAALANATVPQSVTETPLFFNLPVYGTLATMVRPRRRHFDVDIAYTLGNLSQGNVVEFHATDPRFYATPTVTTTIGLPGPSGGFSFPIGFPLSFGGGSSPNIANLDNQGNINCCPTLTITGPCTIPAISNAAITGNPTISFNITLADADQLVIDTDLHSVLYYPGGVASGSAPVNRINTLQSTSTWWTMPGATTSVIQFNSSDTSHVAGTLEIAWSSAYLL